MQIQSKSYRAPTIQGTLQSARDTKINMVQSQPLKDLQPTGKGRDLHNGLKLMPGCKSCSNNENNAVGTKGNKF